MAHNGWRKPTPGLVEAEKHAQVGERLSIPKAQATKAVKKVAAFIGLKMPDIVLLDTLCAFTQEQDWEQGRRPIVWASNAYLEERTGMELRSIQRHVRRLCEAGVMSMKDSPNGKRYGKRDEDGYIQTAYGFDLAPLAARAEEFEHLEAQKAEEREFVKSLKNSLTVTRRVIRAKIEKARESRLRGPWRELETEFGHLLETLPQRNSAAEKLLNILDAFKAFKERVEEAFAAAFDWPEQSDAEQAPQEAQRSSNVVPFSQKMSPKDDSNDTHLLTTNQPNPVDSNCFEEKHAADTEPETQPSIEIESSEKDLDAIQWNTNGRKSKSTEVELSTVMASCPEFADLARGLVGGYVRDWNELHRAAGMIRPMVGISEDAWNVAQKQLSPYVAAAAMALIYEKIAKGEVSSAGGYLRGIVGKAIDGELHLERSFYGRLAGAGGTA